jgi:hypothetical protein
MEQKKQREVVELVGSGQGRAGQGMGGRDEGYADDTRGRRKKERKK